MLFLFRRGPLGCFSSLFLFYLFKTSSAFVSSLNSDIVFTDVVSNCKHMQRQEWHRHNQKQNQRRLMIGKTSIASAAVPNSVSLGVSSVRNGRPSHGKPSTLYYRDREIIEERLTDSNVVVLPQENVEYQLQRDVSQLDTKILSQTNGVAMPLIRDMWRSQGETFILSTAAVIFISYLASGGSFMDLSSMHWNDPHQYYDSASASLSSFHSLFDWELTNIRVLEGIMTAAPMIYLAHNTIKISESRESSFVNFSLENMVVDLFGRREPSKSSLRPGTINGGTAPTTSSDVAIVMAFALSLCKAIPEEIVFRGYLPSVIATFTHSFPLALFGQAILFALAHHSVNQSSTTLEENKVMGGLQVINGIWYGLIYLIFGGDILPCMIGHTLFDMHVFCETWMTTNNQMDYTEKALREQNTEDSEGLQEIIHRLQQEQKQGNGISPVLMKEMFEPARSFFYTFDREHKGSLSLSDVQRAVSFAFLHEKNRPTPDEVQQLFSTVLETRKSLNADISASSLQRQRKHQKPSYRVNFAEFLRLLFALKSSQAWAL